MIRVARCQSEGYIEPVSDGHCDPLPFKLSGMSANAVSYVNILEAPMPEIESVVEWTLVKGAARIELDLRAFEIKTLTAVI